MIYQSNSGGLECDKICTMNIDGADKQRVSPDHGARIIFSSNMDDWHEKLQEYGHNLELYLINQDGSGLERITFNTGFDSFPMFSPDGKKLVFGTNRNPDKPRATNVFIADWVE